MIREYEGRDIHTVMSIWLEASLVSHPFLSREFMEKERGNIARECIPFAEIWVYEEDGEVVGFIAMFGSHIGGLFVRPDMQRQGIGTGLIEHAMTVKGDMLTVEVFEDNKIGRSFYDKKGFGEVSGFIHPDSGKPAIYMKYQNNLSTKGGRKK